MKDICQLSGKGTAEAPLKSKLTSVSIEARANSSDKGYIFLQYNFNNYDVCETEVEAAKKLSLNNQKNASPVITGL